MRVKSAYNYIIGEKTMSLELYKSEVNNLLSILDEVKGRNQKIAKEMALTIRGIKL